MHYNPTSLTRTAGILALGSFLTLALYGCGGGSSSTSNAPSREVKVRIKQMISGSFVAMTNSGLQTPNAAHNLNSSAGLPPQTAGVGASGSIGGSGSVSAPLTGAFLNNAVLSHRNGGRSVRHRAVTGVSGGENAGIRMNNRRDVVVDFYFDDWLGLWTQVVNLTSGTRYDLYLDQAKTLPAGSMQTTFPADTSVFPQVYASSFTYTAGLLTGSHGSYNTTLTSDSAGHSDYEYVGADGSKDTGSSLWDANGESTWKDRSEQPDHSFTAYAGTFHADGSGTTHSESSDGYVTDYTYNADGSGKGHIAGKQSGLPAVIVWDALGNTTIRYADGTTETYNAWTSVDTVGLTNSGGISTALPPTNSSTEKEAASPTRK